MQLTKIICFGDSITLGESDPLGGWADRLKQLLQRINLRQQTDKFSLYNLGIASETTDGLARRFINEISARRYKSDCCWVILAYATNDVVIKKDKNTVPESYYRRNLKTCLDYCQSNQIKVLLLSAPPIDESINGILNVNQQIIRNLDIQRYNQVLCELAEIYACEYLDINALFSVRVRSSHLAVDGIHPNTAGHELIYQNVKQKLSMLSMF